MIDRLYRYIDRRLRIAHFTRSTLDKVFPDNWSFMLGEVALYAFVVLVLTGIYLTAFFHPSSKEIIYHGSYVPLQGVSVSDAFASTVHLSFDVRAGLVFRQIHHWAALVFVAAIVLHLCRIFFTGAFRRPREINWIVGVTLLVLAMLNGFAGYSLPDDLLSGTGLRIGYSIVLSIPVVGQWLAFLLFGGEWPTEAIVPRLYIVHVFVIPLAIIGLISVHMAILWRQKHTQFAGEGRREDNVVGSHLWPTYAARSVGLFFGVFAVLAGLGGLAQINPVWLYGPYKAAATSTAAQPDWYMGWLEGALRLFPGWRMHVFGYPISELFWPAVVLPAATFLLLYSWPFVEQLFTREWATEHHVLDSPRDRPVRTGIGVGALSFYVVLFVAGSQDVLATKLNVSIPPVTWTFRILALALPPVVGLLTWRLCHELQHEDGKALAEEPPAAARSRPGVHAREREHESEHPALRRGVIAGAVAAAAFVGGLVTGRRRPRMVRIERTERDRSD